MLKCLLGKENISLGMKLWINLRGLRGQTALGNIKRLEFSIREVLELGVSPFCEWCGRVCDRIGRVSWFTVISGQ